MCNRGRDTCVRRHHQRWYCGGGRRKQKSCLVRVGAGGARLGKNQGWPQPPRSGKLKEIYRITLLNTTGEGWLILVKKMHLSELKNKCSNFFLENHGKEKKPQLVLFPEFEHGEAMLVQKGLLQDQRTKEWSSMLQKQNAVQMCNHHAKKVKMH